MHPFQVFHVLILITLTPTLTEGQRYSKPRCTDICGQVMIRYPFGIGRNCAANEWYNVDCSSSKPYLPAFNNAEVVLISSSRVSVNMSIIKADCNNPVLDSNLVLSTSQGKSPFQLSGLLNILVVEGYGNAVITENGTIVSGCSARNDIVSDINNCFGDGCCQTTIPYDLKSFTLGLTGLDGDGSCGSAVLVDRNYVESLSSRSIIQENTFHPVVLSWNETFDDNSIRCNETCGEHSIPYPFGIGRNCSESDWFNVYCNSSTPYLSAFNNMEVLRVSLENETVTLNVSMISDCENPLQNINLLLRETPFHFSGIDNLFVVEGCGHGAILEENGTVVGGCTSTCGNDTVNDRNKCFGIGCCQTTVPYDLQSFTFDLTGLERQGRDGICGSAFMVDTYSFIQGRFSRQFVPLTISWTPLDEYDSRECRWCQRDGGVCYTAPSGLFSCRYYENNRSSLGVILGVSISMGLLFLTVIIYALYNMIKKTNSKRKKQGFFKRNGGLLIKQQEATDTGLVQTILFTSNELEKATDHFNENRILGRGGQGIVYKGMLSDGRIVAIKKSKMVNESQLEQFINEVVVLSQVNHRNVVKLLGCCLETEVPLLVSEFISNGTLYDLIHDESGEFSFSLYMRLQIATDIAGALAYLHSASSILIYHRDIKTTNILLDEKYRAKVSDFGTSRFASIDQTHLTTLVKGTFGYLDPEYFQSSQFTEKSDVYSFGVVLLELLTREKPILTRFGEKISLATHFMLAMEEGRVMSIFDTVVTKEGSRTALLALANLAMRCLNLNGKNRPTMKEVAIELEGIRLSHVPSKVQTFFGLVKQYEEFPLAYGESTSTTTTFDELL